MSRRMYAIRQFIAVGFALLAFLACVAKCTGCGGTLVDPATDAELEYRAALLRCVDKATTLAESKACRRQVDQVFLVADGGR